MKYLSLSILLCLVAILTPISSTDQIENANSQSRLALFSRIANHVQQQLSSVFKKNQIATKKHILDRHNQKVLQYAAYKSNPTLLRQRIPITIPTITPPIDIPLSSIPKTFGVKQPLQRINNPPLVSTVKPPFSPSSPNPSYYLSNQNYIEGLENRILGKDNILTGNWNQLQGQKNCALGNLNTVKGNSNNVKGNKAIVVGNSNNVVQTGINQADLY